MDAWAVRRCTHYDVSYQDFSTSGKIYSYKDTYILTQVVRQNISVTSWWNQQKFLPHRTQERFNAFFDLNFINVTVHAQRLGMIATFFAQSVSCARLYGFNRRIWVNCIPCMQRVHKVKKAVLFLRFYHRRNQRTHMIFFRAVYFYCLAMPLYLGWNVPLLTQNSGHWRIFFHRFLPECKKESMQSRESICAYV